MTSALSYQRDVLCDAINKNHSPIYYLNISKELVEKSNKQKKIIRFTGILIALIIFSPTAKAGACSVSDGAVISANCDKATFSAAVDSWTNNATVGTSSSYGVIINSASYDVTNFTNNGTITYSGSSSYDVMFTRATITNFTNTGAITTANGQFGVYNAGTITTLTNTGYILGAWSGKGGLANLGGTTTTFNNGQGGDSSTPQKTKLYVNFVLPTNYNIIVTSASHYGQIYGFSESGTTNFGIHSTSTLISGTTYTAVLQDMSSSSIASGTSGTFSGTDGTYAWTLTDADSDNTWDLNVGAFDAYAPSTLNTLTAIQTTSQSIASQFSGYAMSTNYANMNTYDCGLFDQDGGCFSVGGRYSDVNGNNSSDSSSNAIVAVGGFKINDNFRVAGFVDQQTNSIAPVGIKIDNKGPMLGMSLVWNQHADHLGYQVKVANAYQSKAITITRSAVGDAEAGRGDTEIQVESYVAEVSYQFSDGMKASYRPYAALRRAIIKQNAYTETGVENPLTFDTLEDKSTTVIMGMKGKYKFNDKVTLNGALGVEHDVSSSVDQIQATSSTITGLTPVDLNTSVNKTRPVATLGATYHISSNQSFSAQTQYQELSYTSTSAKTAYFNYSIGF